MKLSRQTVYSKALAIYVAMSFLLGLGVVSLTQAIIVTEFRATERREMSVSTERLQMMLERELQGVEASLTDWLVEPRARGRAIRATGSCSTRGAQAGFCRSL